MHLLHRMKVVVSAMGLPITILETQRIIGFTVSSPKALRYSWPDSENVN
jgi:hypothetical protein